MARFRIVLVVTVFTIGHSTRDLAGFSRVLQAHDVRLLVDIRAFPMSRRHPHFNRQHLELWLPEIGCDYLWEKDLGGRRGKQMPADESPNIALRNPSFRNYGDYMLSDTFRQAIERLVDYDDWFAREVEQGLAAADRGEFIEHEEIRTLIDRRFPG